MPTLLIALFAGCDAECKDPTRLNDMTWAMWHVALDASGESSVDSNYPTYQVFSNGWSKWDLAWAQNGADVNVEITDAKERQGDLNDAIVPTTQSFTGQLLASEENCNALTLELEGDFETTSGTVHTFQYAADLVFTGEHLNGRYTYSDSYAGEGVTGQMSEVHGDVWGTAEDGGGDFDTGFTPYEPG